MQAAPGIVRAAPRAACSPTLQARWRCLGASGGGSASVAGASGGGAAGARRWRLGFGCRRERWRRDLCRRVGRERWRQQRCRRKRSDADRAAARSRAKRRLRTHGVHGDLDSGAKTDRPGNAAGKRAPGPRAYAFRRPAAGTCWGTGTYQVGGEVFTLDMHQLVKFSKLTLDPGSGDEFNCPGQEDMYVSNDGLNFGDAVVQGHVPKDHLDTSASAAVRYSRRRTALRVKPSMPARRRAKPCAVSTSWSVVSQTTNEQPSS